MSKPKFVVGNDYHALNRGNEKQAIFFERENYPFFLRRLKDALQKHSTELLCYCLMPNHFHLVLKEIIENGISSVMLSLQTSYAKAINKRYNRVGHLFQGPFKHIHIDRNEYLLHLSRYIHFNPAEAGLVSKPEDWEFSSFRIEHSSHRTLTGFGTLSELECYQKVTV
ncbi:MAG: transposase [bacterium]